MPKAPQPPKAPTKAEEEAWVKARAARIAWGVQRALSFQAATQGATDRSEKPGCYMRYGTGVART